MAELWYPSGEHNDGAVTDAEYAAGIGWYGPSGVSGQPTDPAPVYRSGGQLLLREGTKIRLLGGHYEVTDEDAVISGVGSNDSGATRHDHAVLRLTWSSMEAALAVREGVPGSGLPPAVRQRGTGVFELPLSQVSVPPGGTIATATITPTCWYVGDSGQIVCTRTTRPPHERGLQIWEVDGAVGRSWISTGTTWVRAAEDSGRSAMDVSTFGAGGVSWTPSHNALYLRNGWVFFQLTVRRSAIMSASTAYNVGSIPPGFRPPFLIQSAAIERDGAATVAVATDGSVVINPGVNSIPANTSVVFATMTWPVA